MTKYKSQTTPSIGSLGVCVGRDILLHASLSLGGMEEVPALSPWSFLSQVFLLGTFP